MHRAGSGCPGRPAWRKLLHYQSTWSGGLESEAGGPSFFLAANGKVSPHAELEATLRGLFSAVTPGAPKDVQHPMCQFPARLLWLTRELHIDRERLPHPACERFVEFRDILDAASLTLVFSSYYLNNPASAFGHTFLLVNSHKSKTSAERELLDFAINFSASADTNYAVAYAVKGIVGAFPGEFTRVPYYLQVRKYNDFESRDLWLYDLALSPDELDLLVAHFWELGSTWFDYYYLTENCSYHILGAIEVAAPRLDFLAKTRVPVAPADTVKLVTDTPGLVTRVSFRPAIRAQVAERVRDLTSTERDLTGALATDPQTPWPTMLPVDRRVKVLDAAADVVDMHYAKELPFDLGGPGAQRKQLLLERRAELAVRSVELHVPVPDDKRPERGHGSRRVGVAGGISTGGSNAGVQRALDLARPRRSGGWLPRLRIPRVPADLGTRGVRPGSRAVPGRRRAVRAHHVAVAADAVRAPHVVEGAARLRSTSTTRDATSARRFACRAAPAPRWRRREAGSWAG